MGIDQAEFRRVMSHFLSGVTVVTTVWEGQPYGITVSAFASLSLDPTLLLVSIDQRSRSHDAIAQAGRFVVNILAAEQQAESVRFAGRGEAQKFAEARYHTGQLGLPVLDGVLAHAECLLHSSLPGGDHTIFVGEVVAGDARDGLPLGYYRGQYRHLEP
jgi:flavin reductase (DIM6/NTAB) family NADH-FMN oxidoreductase RutF